MRILFMRMLGNDLPGLHGKDQTYNNLKFTLENEPELPDTTKGYILNRIANEEELSRLKKLLSKHNVAVWEIPFNKQAFDRLPAFDINDYKELLRICTRQQINIPEIIDIVRQKTHLHNLYVINNNGCRNKCLQIGVEHEYDWILPFDSNSFFAPGDFDELHRALKYYMAQDVVYNIVPQYRLSEQNIPNESLLANDFCSTLHEREPQICFRRDAPLLFNKSIPYGSSPKAELLRALDVPGPWKEWKPYEKLFGISSRSASHVKIGKNSKIYRLNSYCDVNHVDNNNILRVFGFINLLSRIASTDKKKKSIKDWF